VSQQSSDFLDQLEDYFLGGVDDMASWTRLVWDTAAFMLVNGTDNCNITDNPMTIQCGDQKQVGIILT
jgi:glycosylphosphatidylinositol phospholipase D